MSRGSPHPSKCVSVHVPIRILTHPSSALPSCAAGNETKRKGQRWEFNYGPSAAAGSSAFNWTIFIFIVDDGLKMLKLSRCCRVAVGKHCK